MQFKTKTSRPLVAFATTAAILLPVSAAAVEFEISGQINRLVMNVDNGEEDGTVHADNSVSGSRVRIKGMGDLGNDLTAGIYWEYQLQSNPSSKIDDTSLDSDGIGGDVGGGDDFSVRQSNVWFKGNFGKVTLGQGDGASNGSAEVDKSGTTVIQYNGSSSDLLGSMEFGTSGVTVGDARSYFDGLSRSDNIRYDAAIDDISLAASLGNGDKIEFSVRYKIESFEVMLGLWDDKDSGADVQGEAISASWIGANGLNLTAAYGSNDSDGDPDNVYLKVGYKSGANAFGVDWSESSDVGAGDADSVSVAWVRDMMQGVQVYASYRIESLDDVAGEDDITALTGGARVKF
jgi:predicted porin